MELEPADEYARIEGCFRDYKAAPFCLHGHLSQLRLTRLPTDLDGLVWQEGLHRARLARKPVDLKEDLIRSEGEQQIKYIPSSENQELNCVWQSTSLKDRKLPCDDLDLGSIPAVDYDTYIQEIVTKSSVNIRNEWLPLTHVRTSFDEGLAFPPTLERLSLLIQREVECESLSPSPEHNKFKGFMNGNPKSSDELSGLCANGQGGFAYVRPVTPPLTPLSEPPSPYVPEGNATIIDLTSEPSSPVNQIVDRLQRDVQLGQIDSDPTTSNATKLCTPTLELPYCEGNACHNLEAYKVEVPLPFSSSTTTQENDLLTTIPAEVGMDLPEPDETPPGFFEEAFASLLEDRGVNVMRAAEQERLKSFDLVARIPVPVMDFEVPSLEWESLVSAEEQFQSLRSNSKWYIPSYCKDVALESSLRWMPVLHNHGRDAVTEEPPARSLSNRRLLNHDSALLLSSESYLACNNEVIALRPDEEEIDELLPTRTDDGPMCSTREPPSAGLGWEKRTNDSSKAFQGLGASAFPVRKSLESVLPRYQDSDATNHRHVHSASILPKPPSIILQQPQNNFLDAAVAPPVPNIRLPQERGCFLISLGMGRQIFQHLQRSWPAECLIDRDFSRQSLIYQGSNNGPPGSSFLQSDSEADIALTATAGIVVTNLLKIRQKLLPGSKSQAPLRARIESLAQRYDSLFVLVTGNDLTTKICKGQTPADVSAYTDFVLFTTSLDADITIFFVPGGVETLTQWIVAVMCRYSPLSRAHTSFLSPLESTWELFFRQAGMSTIAAQVLAGTLHKEAGPAGLAQFIRMPATERVDRYGRIIGSENMLLSSSLVIDWQWT